MKLWHKKSDDKRPPVEKTDAERRFEKAQQNMDEAAHRLRDALLKKAADRGEHRKS